MNPEEIKEIISEEALKEITDLTKQHARKVICAYLDLEVDIWGAVKTTDKGVVPKWFETDTKIQAHIKKFKEGIIKKFSLYFTEKLQKEIIDVVVQSIKWSLERDLRYYYDREYARSLNEQMKGQLHELANTTVLEIANRLKE